MQAAAAKALVTGATGFVGRHLVRHLAQHGWQVRCLVRSPAKAQRASLGDVELHEGDLGNEAGLRRALQGQDVVFHVAGLTSAVHRPSLVQANVQGTELLTRLASLSATPPVLVYVSSLAAAGTSPPRSARRGSEPARPVSDYGRSKLGGELAVCRWAHRLPATIVRPGIVFGPENTETFPVFQSVVRFGVHAVPTWSDRGVALIHVEDLCQLLLLAARGGTRLDVAGNQGVYFAADPCCPTYLKWGQWIAQSIGHPDPLVVRVPEPVLWMVAAANHFKTRRFGSTDNFNLDKMREATAGHWICRSDLARLELDFHPARSLRERLGQTVRWYQQQGWLPRQRPLRQGVRRVEQTN